MPTTSPSLSADDHINQLTPRIHTLQNSDPGTTAPTVSSDMTKPSSTSDHQSSEFNPAENPTAHQPQQLQSSPSSAPPSSAPATITQENPHLTTLRTKITTLESQLDSLRTNLNSTHAQLRDQLLKNQQHQDQSLQTTPSVNPTLKPPPPPPSSPSPSNAPNSGSESQTQPQLEAQAQSIVTNHISLLHTYNEIKDIGLGLMGLIADERGVRVKEVTREFGVGDKD